MAPKRDSRGRFVKGDKEMLRKLKSLQNKFPDEIKIALRIEAERVMKDSKQNFVPVESGVLRSTGFVADPYRKGDDVSVSLSYGGAAAPYATALHEHPSESSPPTWEGKALVFTKEGTGPKYLETPLKNAIPGMADRMAKTLELSKLVK